MTIFWLIVAIAIMAAFQVAYYNKRGFSGVSYDRSFSKKRVFAGESLEMIEVIANNKLMPLPWVRGESRVSPHLRFGRQENLEIAMRSFHKSVFFIGAYRRITRKHRVEATHRGYFDCGLVSLTVGDLLGFSHEGCDVRVDGARLIVYPRIALPGELPEKALEWQGDVSVHRWIDPDPIQVVSVREYLPGDSRRDIHWAATARTGQMQVKVRDYTVTPKLLVLLNAQIREDLWGEMTREQRGFMENAVSISAALCAWAANAGLGVGFRCNSSSIFGFKRGDIVSIEPQTGALESILETMAFLELKVQMNYMLMLDAEIDRRTGGMDILCVSAYWSEELEDRAARLRRLGNNVLHIPVKGDEAV